jgi:3-deoxy-7-phosphoheptulonate synthase
MVFILNHDAPEARVAEFIRSWEARGFSTIFSKGTVHNAVCLIGDTKEIDLDHIVQTTDIVSYGKRVTEPYKAVNRAVHPEDTIVKIGGRPIGQGTFTVIAGPCSVEGKEQILDVSRAVKASGAHLLRGGAFKPRTSPYAFQGMKEEGLALLKMARAETGLPIVSEIMNQTQAELFEDIDVVQIGARNMQNFDLLKVVGQMKKPVLLKRGLSSTLEELMMSAEYIMSSGNPNVILCERGIRTFETATRNTLDLSAVVVLKQKTHLPVVVDPSHGTGIRSLVAPMSKAALAVGADGLIVEVHNDPAKALSDGAQSLDPGQFEELMGELRIRAAIERRII